MNKITINKNLTIHTRPAEGEGYEIAATSVDYSPEVSADFQYVANELLNRVIYLESELEKLRPLSTKGHITRTAVLLPHHMYVKGMQKYMPEEFRKAGVHVVADDSAFYMAGAQIYDLHVHPDCKGSEAERYMWSRVRQMRGE